MIQIVLSSIFNCFNVLLFCNRNTTQQRPSRDSSCAHQLCLAALAFMTFPDFGYATQDTLRLDGEVDRVIVNHSPQLNIGGGITIEAWVRPRSSTGCQTIVGKNINNGYWLGLCDGVIRFYTNGLDSNLDGVRIIPIGSWTHVAVSFDGTTRRYYMNGVLDLEEITPGSFPVNITSLGIGGEAAVTGDLREFVGDLAEVRLWKTARSQSDIRRDLIVQVDTPDPNLVAVWHLQGSALDAIGSLHGELRGDAGFDGSTAPPIVSGPLRIPRLSTLPEVDGICRGENGLFRVPIWYDDGFFIHHATWAQVGATSDRLFVCIKDLPQNFTEPLPSAALYIDPGADGGLFAQNNDYRFIYQNDGVFDSQRGDGLGDYVNAESLGVDVESNGTDLMWSVEFSIPRSVIETDGEGLFGLLLVNHNHHTEGANYDEHGWPETAEWNAPESWIVASIDDSLIPVTDGAPPVIDAWYRPISPAPTINDEITIEASATDDVALSSITLFLDGVPIKVCDTPPSTTSGSCSYRSKLSAGRHLFYAVVRDRAGRQGGSELKAIFVVLDGELPTITKSHLPQLPGSGETITMRATALSPVGIKTIIIYAGTEAKVCEFLSTPSIPEIARCSYQVTPAADVRILRYFALAIDSNEERSVTPSTNILIGNTGADTDHDGISDALEEYLCTRADSIDTDRDGLTDGWELLGLRFPDGDFTNLPGLGSNPCRKDVFLQFDHEVGADLEEGVKQSVVNAFRRHDAALHIKGKERPRPPGNPTSPLNGLTAGFQKDASGKYYFPPKYNWTHYYGYSKHYPGRSSSNENNRTFTIDIYHKDSTCECPLDGSIDPAVCGTDGDSVTTCKRYEPFFLAKDRLMHELGHAMGLGHGGRDVDSEEPTIDGDYIYYPGSWDSDNHKPNYSSVMNYGNSGVNCLIPSADSVTQPDNVFIMTYSDIDMGDLNEDELNESPDSEFSRGIRGLDCSEAEPGAVPVVFYTCVDYTEENTMDIDLVTGGARVAMMTDGEQTRWRWRHGVGWEISGWISHEAGVDLNCDGEIATSSGNVNGDNFDYQSPPFSEICGDGVDNNGNSKVDEGCWEVVDNQTLIGRDDWSVVPSPPSCILPYKLESSVQCYTQPEEYREQIGANAPDCRPIGWPDVTCDDIPIVFSATESDVAKVTSINAESSSGPLTETEQFILPLPNTEACDGHDNDGDHKVDEGCRDTDSDGIADAIDNCPDTYNADQADLDGNYLGDICQNPGPVQDLVIANARLNDPAYYQARIHWGGIQDVAGYTIFRYEPESQNPRYLGDGYPTVRGNRQSYIDRLENPEPGTYRYIIRPVNLNGQEGADAEISVNTDLDADGISDDSDNCQDFKNSGQIDSDNDGVGDSCDNCIEVANGPNILDAGGNSQLDSDQDGYGNLCDGDLDNSGFVDATDKGIIISALGTSDPIADLDGNGVVDNADLAIFETLLNKPPGPSAYPSANLDQQQPEVERPPQTNYVIGGTSDQRLAQVVTAGFAGNLVQIGAPVICGTGSDLILEIRNVVIDTDGRYAPGTTIRNKTIISGDRLPIFSDPNNPDYRLLNLGMPVSIRTGEMFAFTLNSDGACGIPKAPKGDLYSGGDAWITNIPFLPDDWHPLHLNKGQYDLDLPFETWMEVNPFAPHALADLSTSAVVAVSTDGNSQPEAFTLKAELTLAPAHNGLAPDQEDITVVVYYPVSMGAPPENAAALRFHIPAGSLSRIGNNTYSLTDQDPAINGAHLYFLEGESMADITTGLASLTTELTQANSQGDYWRLVLEAEQIEITDPIFQPLAGGGTTRIILGNDYGTANTQNIDLSAIQDPTFQAQGVENFRTLNLNEWSLATDENGMPRVTFKVHLDLGMVSDGIDPNSEGLSLQARYPVTPILPLPETFTTITVPAGAIKLKHNTWELDVEDASLAGVSWLYTVEGQNTELAGQLTHFRVGIAPKGPGGFDVTISADISPQADLPPYNSLGASERLDVLLGNDGGRLRVEQAEWQQVIDPTF